MFEGKKIVLGVTGGIAAYKACDIVSRLLKTGAEVKVIMTSSACEFVSPVTFRALSNNPVASSVFDEPNKWDINHISLARWADAFLIAPATANIIGKIANGIADDMLSTTVMATKAPVVVAPAMNTSMYENPILQKNIKYLSGLGYSFCGVRQSRLACGDVGKGALLENEDILEVLSGALCSDKGLKGKNVLVTAGPTQEAIDPVRFITNHSSGKMGYAVARAAIRHGANVTLVSGKTNQRPPYGAKLVLIESADSMFDACVEHGKNADIIIKAAAVADYKPKLAAANKLKKGDSEKTIELTANRDILKTLGENKGHRVLVGFCMETENLLANAVEKLKNKNADMIVANTLNDKDAGFGVDTNTITILRKNREPYSFPNMSKDKAAENIILAAIEILGELT